jgi:hypothetical protein
MGPGRADAGAAVPRRANVGPGRVEAGAAGPHRALMQGQRRHGGAPAVVVKLFLGRGRPIGFMPRRKRMSTIFVFAGSPKRIDWTDSGTKMSRLV